jgi:hypothetical protein
MDLLPREDDGSLGDISAASWTPRGPAENVFRGFGIATGKFIENAVESYFRTVAALITTADHALRRSAQILTNELDSHFLQRRIEVIGDGESFIRIQVIAESNQSIFIHSIETARTFRWFRQNSIRGTFVCSRFVQ